LDTVPTHEPLPHRLCTSAVSLLHVQGASVSLSCKGFPSTLYATNDVAAEVEELQFTTGEGPCIEAVRDARLVQATDFAEVHQRWPAFASGLTPGDVNSMFAFPLQVGAAVIGALDCYRVASETFTYDEVSDALAVTQLITTAVLDLQAGAPPDMLAAELGFGGWGRAEIHQAAGMISADLHISVGDALVRLRAHAFGHGQPVGDVARAIVLRIVTLAPNDDGKE